MGLRLLARPLRGKRLRRIRKALSSRAVEPRFHPTPSSNSASHKWRMGGFDSPRRKCLIYREQRNSDSPPFIVREGQISASIRSVSAGVSPSGMQKACIAQLEQLAPARFSAGVAGEVIPGGDTGACTMVRTSE